MEVVKKKYMKRISERRGDERTEELKDHTIGSLIIVTHLLIFLR
jgi:hypothetical protein